MRDRARYEPIARQAATVAGIDPDLFVAQITAESQWDDSAVSYGGAVGIAQIIPQWHPGVDPRNPEASLAYAANLMASYIREFGSERLALRAYNGGPSSLRATGTPPPGTDGYASTILAERDRIRAERAEAPDSGEPINNPMTVTDSAPPSVEVPAGGVFTVAALASPAPVDRRWVVAALAALAALTLAVVLDG